MLKLGFLAGLLAGAVIAALLSEPNDEQVPQADEPEPGSIVDRVKRQLNEARLAARDEMKAKEAKLLRDYEDTRQARDRN